jgi:hypothetical protein
MSTISLTRRNLLALAAASTFAAGLPSPARAASPKPFPLPEELKDGDLVWPKLPGAFIPYSYMGADSAPLDETEWEAGKRAYLAATPVTMDNVDLINQLDSLTYARFRANYLAGKVEGQLIPYGYGPDSMVGHVAIVRLAEDGTPWMVEAIPAPGVHSVTYEDWKNARPGEIAWHGRIMNLAVEQRRAVADAARAFSGAPYDFWKFRLDDESGFYCSKLIWLAAMRGASIALDGNPDPNRLVWLSPKQLLNAPGIDMLLDQGDYAFD